MIVRDITSAIQEFAPLPIQESWDNSGLIIGSPEQEVKGVLVGFDCTPELVDEAIAYGADMIVTHHPLMINSIRSLTDDTYEGRLLCRLVKENISLIAAHTNLDQAPGGINDTLAELCGLTEISGEGFLRCGLLPSPLTAAEYARALRNRLRTEVRLMGPQDAVIRKVGLCSGGGSDEWHSALLAGCDAFISGEIKHHHALDMADNRLVGLECGHFSTEEPGIRALASALQNVLNTVEYKVRIYVSEISAYSFPRQP